MSGSISRINLDASLADGRLTINGVNMHTYGFAMLDVTPLWTEPDIRGDDLLIPGMTGLMPMPRRVTGTAKSLPMLIDGRYDRIGNQWSNEREGLRRNIAFLRSYVVNTGYSYITLTTREIEEDDDGNPLTDDAPPILDGYGYVTGLEVGREYGPIWRASLELFFPYGGIY